MSGDEMFVLMVCLVIGAVRWGHWYWRLLSLPQGGAAARWLGVAPVVFLLMLFGVLLRWSSQDVRSDPTYLFFYECMGVAWVGLGVWLCGLMGISARDDVAERRNEAAGWAIGGAIGGITACFAGGNVGDGPGWWVVVFCAVLSTGALFVSWGVVQEVTGASDSITIDHDVASGVRLGGVLLASGLILGRAVAGNWVSADATMSDFARLGWPVLVLVMAESILGRQFRPTPEVPRVPLVWGFGPAVGYLVFALAVLVVEGAA
ncbi:MAG TPA: hypothetical protein VM008_11600 [Phycisphaerae bacterium]|nr:hypothetical protein [Phycisphaerae bacterium]